ncbi:MAG: hypothetical protein H6Q74_2228 [Firmicutes bacterium]|nr:hypothetical protein [Bacillota bacterium]
MRKSMAALLLGLNLSIASVGWAADPVSLAGDVSIKYEKDTAADSADISGAMYSFKLKGVTDIGGGWSLYARIGAQYATQPSLSDYNLDLYGENKKSVVALDQFGIGYKSEKLVYKLGRQDVAVGTTALLYSRPDSNIGKKNFADGLTVSGTIGTLEVAAVLAQEDNVGTQDNKVYAIRTGYSPTERLNYGITLGRYQDVVNESTNHWAVDGTYQLGANSLKTEFTKSSSSGDNKAYVASWNHSFSDKTAGYVTGFRVETNGDMGKQSDFDNDNRGVYYGITYKLNDADGLEVVYKDQKIISSGENNTKLEATFSHTF